MSKLNSKQKIYAQLHLLEKFFENHDVWEKNRHFAGVEASLAFQDYEDLYRGTNAHVYVPVWASCAKSGTLTLLDSTTLEVVDFYHEYGYEPVKIDHNPPDYIGEQLRFLEYLAACEINGNECCGKAITEFVDRFALDTAKVVAEESKKFVQDPELDFVMDMLIGTLTGKEYDLPVTEEDLKGFESYASTRKEAIPSGEEKATPHVSFSDCGKKCSMMSYSRNGCVTRMEANTTHPEIKFQGCPRGRGYRHTYLSAARLRYPMERIGERGDGRFRRISWEEAENKVMKAIIEAREKYGVGSRFQSADAGNVAMIAGSKFMGLLLALDGGNLGFYNYYSAAASQHITPMILGDYFAGNVFDDVENTNLLILWGNNPATNHFGYGRNESYMRLKEKGVKIIVIDPRMSDTVISYADQWIPIKPSSDSALADAMCYVIFRDNLQDQEFIDKFTIGFDEDHMPEGVPAGKSYKSYLFGVEDGIHKDPKWAEEITGVPADVIEQLAREYATAKPACLLPGFAPQRTFNGEQAFFNFMALAALTGNVGKKGGSSGSYAIRKGHDGVGIKLRPKNPYPVSIPSFLWTLAVEHPEIINPVDHGLRGAEKLEAPIKFISCIASGMLMTQHSNTNNTLKLLREPGLIDNILVCDLFMSPSATAADILIPAVSFFEIENIAHPWGGGEYILYNNRCIDYLFDAKWEFDWINNIAKKMGYDEEFNRGLKTGRDWCKSAWENFMASEPEAADYDFETLEKSGVFMFKSHPHIVAFQEQIEDGVPFGTPSGKIEIFCKRIYDMNQHDLLPGRPGFVYTEEGPVDYERMKKYPLQFTTFHTKRHCHSQHENNAFMEEIETQKVWINPVDAEARGIEDGELVEVFNDRGVVRVPAKVTDRIMKGVIAMSEGYWYKPDKDGVDIRGSINTLTHSHRATPLGKANPQLTNLADVRKYAK